MRMCGCRCEWETKKVPCYTNFTAIQQQPLFWTWSSITKDQVTWLINLVWHWQRRLSVWGQETMSMKPVSHNNCKSQIKLAKQVGYLFCSCCSCISAASSYWFKILVFTEAFIITAFKSDSEAHTSWLACKVHLYSYKSCSVVEDLLSSTHFSHRPTFSSSSRTALTRANWSILFTCPQTDELCILYMDMSEQWLSYRKLCKSTIRFRIQAYSRHHPRYVAVLMHVVVTNVDLYRILSSSLLRLMLLLAENDFVRLRWSVQILIVVIVVQISWNARNVCMLKRRQQLDMSTAYK